MKNIKFPKIKVRLTIILWVLFMAVVVVEGGLLLKRLYFDTLTASQILPPGGEATIQIDISTFHKAADWLEAAKKYQLPNYSFRHGADGRDNVFVEY